jgi:peptidoglycan/LPS O-acetylase OafA/YrhL
MGQSVLSSSRPAYRRHRGSPLGAPRGGVRADIQGLRALAVSTVFVYHLWPQGFTGGFVGVDVFFVISGFLITSHLLAHPPRTARDLVTFWSRRIRRLLPAALFVLTATLIATRLLAPPTYWADTAAQVRASALYVVNWRLAHDSVDYLASTNAPTPVQHFWSLSVEEQFYLGWPILILLLCLVAQLARRRSVMPVSVGLAVVTGLSFAYSVHETAVNPAEAYFVTPTRIWELGVGGLLAAAVSARAFGRTRDTEALPLPRWARVVLAWIGLAAILWASMRYTGSTSFPGWRAAVPVLGAAAVIGAQAPSGLLSPLTFLAPRPVGWLGDVSYSVYLWHAPLIVLVPFVTGNHRDALDDIAIIGAVLVLSGLTKPLIEDPFRRPGWGVPLYKPYLLAAAGMVVVVSAAQLQTAEVHYRIVQASTATKRAIATHAPCFGAAALAAPAGACPIDNAGPLTPSPIAASSDKSDAYEKHGSGDCFAAQPAYALRTCHFGDTSSSIKVALVGNSHAGQWLPALEAVAKEEHWQITTYLASRCAFAQTAQDFDTNAETRACLKWVRAAESKLEQGNFNLIVMTNRISVGAVGYTYARSASAYERGYAAVLQALDAAGKRVVVIHDTPAPGIAIPDCLAEHTSNHSACDTPRARALRIDPALDAVSTRHAAHVTAIDLSDHICEKAICQAAVGGVPVYFDQTHLTATYSTTLGPSLEPVLVRALVVP